MDACPDAREDYQQPSRKQMKMLPSQRLEKPHVMLVEGYDPGNTFERTCCNIRASCFSTGEMLSCSSSILMVRSKRSRIVLSFTSEDSSGNGEVYVAESTSMLPNCLYPDQQAWTSSRKVDLRMCRPKYVGDDQSSRHFVKRSRASDRRFNAFPRG